MILTSARSLRVLAQGECKVQYVGHTAGVTDVAVQPTGKMFASASVDRSIRLWSCTLPATGGDVSAAAGSTGKRRRTGNAETIPLQKSLGIVACHASSFTFYHASSRQIQIPAQMNDSFSPVI